MTCLFHLANQLQPDFWFQWPIRFIHNMILTMVQLQQPSVDPFCIMRTAQQNHHKRPDTWSTKDWMHYTDYMIRSSTKFRSHQLVQQHTKSRALITLGRGGGGGGNFGLDDTSVVVFVFERCFPLLLPCVCFLPLARSVATRSSSLTPFYKSFLTFNF